ncbi:class I SAM-dependent methyltransferase [Flavitalea antarctica]
MKRTEIYTDGTYLETKPDWDEKDSVYKVGWLNQLLTRQPISIKSVIEVGCGSGRVLHELSQTMATDTAYTGYDISPQAIRLAQKYRSDKIRFIEGDYLVPGTPKADLILMFDVLEHVPDYYGFLESLKNKGNFFAFHIPLDLSCRTLLKPYVMLQQRDSVGHIHYFSREMVLWMLKDTGYQVIDWIYTSQVTDPKRAKGFKHAVKRSLRDISFSLNKNRSADLWGDYSMMILAR